jgi:hypothetical protein
MKNQPNGGKTPEVKEASISYWDSTLEKFIKVDDAFVFAKCKEEDQDLQIDKSRFEDNKSVLKKLADKHDMRIFESKNSVSFVARSHLKELNINLVKRS